MKKQFLFTMMALLPMVASADDSGTCGEKHYYENPSAIWLTDIFISDNVKWTYVESTHTLTISGNGKMTKFSCGISTIYPEEISFDVTPPWDKFKDKIQNLVVQSGVTSVDGLMDCNNLTSVSLPNTLEEIEPYAFQGCAISSINIPNGVREIGVGAFKGCNNLTSITIPNSVHLVGPFMSCGLKSIQVDSGGRYDSRDNCNAIISWDGYFDGQGNEIVTVYLEAGCKNTIIPDGVTCINTYAFAGTGLSTLTIPQSVNTIYDDAFDDCSDLSAVYCYASEVPAIVKRNGGGDGYFRSVQNAILYVPSTLVDKYKDWGGFKAVMPIENASDPKCATPTIKAENGILKFECATEGVEFHYNVQLSSDYETSYSGTYNKANDSGINGVELPYATISVYASKSGYSLSDTATLTVKLSNGKLGDLNGDGEVNVADHVVLSSIILDQNK